MLRKESGAAIADSEFINAQFQYLPIPGDDEQTLANKARNRQVATDGFLRSTNSRVAPQTETINKDIQSIVKNHVTFEGNKAFIPREIWQTLGSQMDTLIQLAEKDGFTLLVTD